MKAAIRGHEEAAIVDGVKKKLHVYETGVRQVNASEETHFSKKHGLNRKPVVKKKYYSPMPDWPPEMTRSNWSAEACRNCV